MFKGLWQSSWKLLNTNISVGETIQGGVDTTKAVLDLSKAISENKALPELTPLLGHLSSILDVLNLPIVQLAGSALPFVSIASKLLQFYLDSTKEDPSLEDCVELVGQAAYLESFKKFFSDDANKHLLEKLNKAKASDHLQEKISQFSKSLTLTESEARTVLLCFHESKLAEGLNPIVLERLVEAGIEEGQAKIIVERISRMTHREIKPALAEIKDKVKKLSVIYGSEWQRELETYDSIDRYLNEVIAEKPKEKVFEENFGFEDIYVELQVEAIAKDGSRGKTQFIEEWALGLLNDESKSGQVLFIQGEPGRGKSVFCRMFADRVRRELYPIWTPILIRLRDITNFADDFDTLLRDAVNTDFARNDNGWLTDRNTRFLFILDGFDELLLQRGRDRSLKDFLERVSSFQNGCKNIKERGHRIIITGRPLALFGIEREMPPNLERVKILDMSEEIQNRWLQRWATIKGKEKAEELQEFISHKEYPKEVNTLAKEPLLLYLLAAMYGDNRFKIEDFKSGGNSAKILIYDETLDWFLTKQRNEKLNPRLTGLEVEDIRDILKEAGLCVAQSEGECVALEVIESRLAPDLRDALMDARKDKSQDTLPIALATFYVKASDRRNNSMEFLHKSFGEFLCAERMVDSLVAWSRKKLYLHRTNKQIWEVEDKAFEWQVYDLFGFGSLTFEIVEYLTALIEREFIKKEEDFLRLFERMYSFYWAWSNGDFIEAINLYGEILPLNKAHLMQKQGVCIGQRKVDIYTGLNVLILMFTFHRYALRNSNIKDKVTFHPCKYKTKDGIIDDASRLMRIIGYVQSLNDSSFINIVGKFLNDVDLNGAILSGVDLNNAEFSNTNLSHAYLFGTNLSGAYLFNSNLMGSNLSGANLSRTFLNSANLNGATLNGADLNEATLNSANMSRSDINLVNLSGADLRGVNFTGVDIRNVDLSGANFSGVNLSGIFLSTSHIIFANLSYTNLSYANLSGLDLSGVNLSYANLNNTNLRNTKIYGVNIIGANFNNVDLYDVSYDENTIWGNTIGLNKAINVPDNLINNTKFKAAVLLCDGYDLVISGDIDAALTAYNNAQRSDPDLQISVHFWHQLGLWGCLYGRASDVLFACENVLKSNLSARSLSTRGLAYALTGNLSGAIKDFDSAIKISKIEYSKFRGGYLENSRERWLEALKSGINPFTPEELEALRASEGATS